MRDGRGSCGERVTSQTRNGKAMSEPERSAVMGGRGSLAFERGERARPGAPGTEDGLRHDLREATALGPGENPPPGNLEVAAQTSPVVFSENIVFVLSTSKSDRTYVCITKIL